jgi:hypothetical protein
MSIMKRGLTLFNLLLKDFKLHEWSEAADSCEFCGVKFEVRITWVDRTGCFGDIEWRISHRPDCPGKLDEETGEEANFESLIDIAGWEFIDKPISLNGREFLPLKCRANVGPCLNCGRLIIGVPLILFIAKGEGGELDFCFGCAEKLGILDNLVRSDKG